MTIINGFIRSGMDNHMTKHPDAIVRRVKLLRSRGYMPSEIRDHLRDEGHDINLSTIQNWCLGNSRGKV